jgi:aspartate-semialdehyde dehydrogenase
MHENEETCTLEKVREAISDELSDLFHKSNSGIQNAFELIFGVLKEQEEKYKADHERLREENKTLIENMKIMQESNLSILEALNRKEVSSSKLEDVVVEMNQLVSREKEMEEDQIKSKELLKHVSEKVKVSLIRYYEII